MLYLHGRDKSVDEDVNYEPDRRSPDLSLNEISRSNRSNAMQTCSNLQGNGWGSAAVLARLHFLVEGCELRLLSFL